MVSYAIYLTEHIFSNGLKWTVPLEERVYSSFESTVTLLLVED